MRSFFFFLSVLAIVSCSQDAYETGDSPLSYLRADMVDMHVEGDEVKSIVTDEDEALIFGKLRVAKELARPDTTYRALLYYNKVEGKEIEVQSSSLARLLEPKTEKLFEADDPLTYTSGWMAANGRYVNLSLGLKVGTVEDKDAEQGVFLCLDSEETLASGHKRYHLSLRHDQNGMPEFYTKTFYFCIPVYDFAEGDELELTVNTYKGKIVRSFVKKKSNDK